MSNSSDQEIIQAVLAGQKEQYTTLIEKYQRQVFGYLLRFLNFKRQDAEDVLSETFLKAYVNLASFNPNLAFSAWLYRIAHNEAVNLIKKNSKTLIVDMTQLKPQETLINYPEEEAFARKEDLEKVLSQLSLDERNLLILFYLEEKSVKEISLILKITENNVKVKLNRAKNRAKALVDKFT